MGSGWIQFYREKVKPQWRIAFLSAFVIGFLIHAYKFTNALPNHDTLYNYYSDQNVIGSGRWLLSIACGFSSYFDLPWMNGMLSLLFMALTAVVVVDAFRIDNPVLISLASAVLVAFPGITETLFFSFTADGYMLAMFLAAVAAWITQMDKVSKRSIFFASACISACCAIYQAYVSFALILAICCFMLELLENRHTLKEMWIWILQQAVVYGGGLAAFYLLWKVLLKIEGFEANSYQGIDSLTLSFATILQGIPSTIKSLVLFFVEWNPLEHGWTLYAVLNVVFLICACIAVVCACVKARVYRRKLSFILFVLCLIALPFAACIWHFASPGVGYRPMMLQSLCIVYIFVAVLFEKYTSMTMKNGFALLLFACIFNNAVIANISYYYMNRTHYATFATAAEMITRIHSLDTRSKEIAVVGDLLEEVSLDREAHGPKIHMLGQLLETNLMYDEIHLIDFINETFYSDYVGAGQKVKNIERERIEQMGCWPAKDSIQVIDDMIVIKIDELEEE